MPKIYAIQSPAVTQREIDHMTLSRKVAGECVVLLENDGTLPIQQGGKIALFGNGARRTVRGGTGSGDVNTRSDVNIEEGLEAAGFTVSTKAWLDRQDAYHAKAHKEYLDWVPGYAEQKNMSQFLVTFTHPFAVVAPVEITEEDIAKAGADTAVYVIARNSGEGADRFHKRGDYLLYEEEKAQLELLSKSYSKVILVLNIGGIIDMAEIKAISGINAVLLLSQLGNTSGDVLADVLTGAVCPSGKLTDTWAQWYEDYPSSKGFSHNDGNVDDEYYTEGIYVGYRYFDSFGVEPLYPFGYGMSYTAFSVVPGTVSVREGRVRIFVTVTNTGNTYSGKEVVQVYYSAPSGSLPKPFQELACFAKTGLLAPGENETLELSFEVKDMASYCEACAAWVLEPGDYILRVGTSSRNTQIAAILTLDKMVQTAVVRNLFQDADPVVEMDAPAYKQGSADSCGTHIALCASEIATAETVYLSERKVYTTDQTKILTAEDVKNGTCTVEELVAQLSVEELADFCVGTLRGGNASIIGSASYNIPGAAGDTSSIVKESRGIRNLILADGPAGLRLQPVFKTTKDGKLLPGGSILGDLYVPFDPKYTDENSNTYYQYCTAIPIGWALAQSWNMELLEQIGSMVGEEMEQFGIDLWLAPALNIHRNPLCGRNFEYYSEDPVISGKAAAAITNGVQSHPGRGTTIKHFAANSQEDNRYFTNSHVSERTLREIYLRGFEIAVKESQPMSIMTSYNLLNGIHTANHFDLNQSVARDEWGFQGVIMTDWYTSQKRPSLTGEDKAYPISASTGCIFSGNDIQMPGCQKNVDDIVMAVKTGEQIDGFTITLADLQFCAANVIRTVLRASI